MSIWYTPREIMTRVAIIRGAVGDPEAAHGMEDCLHRDLLSAIAEDRCTDPKACATEALKTLEIDFPRWCA